MNIEQIQDKKKKEKKTKQAQTNNNALDLLKLNQLND